MRSVKTILYSFLVVGGVAAVSWVVQAQSPNGCTPVECYRLALEKLQAAEDRARSAEAAIVNRMKVLDEEFERKLLATKAEYFADIEPSLRSIRGDVSQLNLRIGGANGRIDGIISGSGSQSVDDEAVNRAGRQNSIRCARGKYLAGMRFYWAEPCMNCGNRGLLNRIEAVCRQIGS